MRLLGLVAVRNELQHLPGLLESVASQVDGLVALDDGSSDGSAEWLEERAEVLELLRIPSDRPRWDDSANNRALCEAALGHGADWVVRVDADERLEREFRRRAERAIERGRLLGVRAFAVRLHDLWDSVDRYRVDGPWGRKWVRRLFRPLPGDRYSDAAVHPQKAPLEVGRMPLADLRIYHLGMLSAEDRRARRQRYERLDPDGRWQRAGYAYLTDEAGLRLRPVPAARTFAT